MTLTALTRVATLAAIFAGGTSTAATAQTNAADPHHPDTAVVQATPPAEPGDTAGQDQHEPSGQPGMMPPGMMGQGMMQPGMRGAMPMMRMRGHMMKIMFAIADADGDGGLSFEEIATIQKRIFGKVDADRDDKVTPEEVQAFLRE